MFTRKKEGLGQDFLLFSKTYLKNSGKYEKLCNGFERLLKKC